MVERLSAVVARRVREVRLAAGISQVQLAERMKVAPGEISRLETGRRSPNLETIEKLGAALGVEPASLLARREAPHAVTAAEEIAVLLRDQPDETRSRIVAAIRALVG